MRSVFFPPTESPFAKGENAANSEGHEERQCSPKDEILQKRHPGVRETTTYAHMEYNRFLQIRVQDCSGRGVGDLPREHGHLTR